MLGSLRSKLLEKRKQDKVFFTTLSSSHGNITFTDFQKTLEEKKKLDRSFYTKFDAVIELMNILIVRPT